MIEVYDIQDEKKPLDITPELAVMAAEVLKQYCKNTECRDCAFKSSNLCSTLDYPEIWVLPERRKEDGKEERKI